MVFLAVSWWVMGIWVALGMCSLLLIGVVLIQESKGGGLAGLAGGAVGESMLGARGNKELAKFTVFIAVGFFLLCIAAGVAGKSEMDSGLQFQAPGGSGTVETPSGGGVGAGGGDTGGGDTEASGDGSSEDGG